MVSVIVSLAPEVSARPNIDEVANMAEAIRYLEQLDKYYSQVARPRWVADINNRNYCSFMPIAPCSPDTRER